MMLTMRTAKSHPGPAGTACAKGTLLAIVYTVVVVAAMSAIGLQSMKTPPPSAVDSHGAHAFESAMAMMQAAPAPNANTTAHKTRAP
jgi:hypothetical protein